MSSSPSRAPAAPESVKESAGVLPFYYFDVAAAVVAAVGTKETVPDLSAVVEAREAGRQQGERESHAKFEAALAHERLGVAKALADFARERAAYYQKIEGEAVQLALSIARKILHREAQVDPLLLMGIVRVALEGIEGATSVVLAVHPQPAAGWRKYLGAHMETGKLPEIKEDPALGLEQCELRTAMGTAALGLEVQLKEIEQGLTDLLAARPQQKIESLSD